MDMKQFKLIIKLLQIPSCFRGTNLHTNQTKGEEAEGNQTIQGGSSASDAVHRVVTRRRSGTPPPKKGIGSALSTQLKKQLWLMIELPFPSKELKPPPTSYTLLNLHLTASDDNSSYLACIVPYNCLKPPSNLHSMDQNTNGNQSNEIEFPGFMRDQMSYFNELSAIFNHPPLMVEEASCICNDNTSSYTMMPSFGDVFDSGVFTFLISFFLG
ncbi:hypothetical protein F3Y22_tig00110270pilonHSYRG00191 [Hibiscus syriacus]|uniref:Uncharacterized protein n=1 Tax=Hibiscus syriacus TaxID=106335 RepID=A0A6A3B937_HIBSY|nr:hypothetical protein F3Y22_tig00110270pilonHSYRG00191 [Hibiscus syriacus]